MFYSKLAVVGSLVFFLTVLLLYTFKGEEIENNKDFLYLVLVATSLMPMTALLAYKNIKK